ncbi:MAG: VIT domain-containing protein [Kofleriaceae bacterium]
MQTQLPAAPTRTPPILPEPPTRGAELVTRDGRSLPLVSARLHADASGGIARVVLEQRFENRSSETLHVTYRMPLPADGAVSGYAFQVAGRTITGRIDRKRAARERFERAVASGKTAGLLEQERADIFTQSIGNLPARTMLVAFIAVDVKLAWLPEGEWELRFPTVIGPRYVGASDLPADARATAVTTAAKGVAARIQIAVKIGDAIRAGRAPGSPSHALQAGHDGVLELRDVAGAKLDRDIVVRWPVAGAAVGLALQVARPAERDEAYGLLTIVPPAREVNHRAVARDLIVLIDTSGSMSGGPLDTAKRVVAQLIESLGDGDRLELIEFSDEPRRYRAQPVQITRDEKQAAIRWVRGLQAGSSTEMRAAVIEAMRSLRPHAQRQVVLATDGYIGGEAHIIDQLYRELPRSCRLHFLGVGSAVNRSLSTAMARAGRGAEVLCDLDEDVERAARRLIDRTRMPILTNVTLAGSALVGQAPELLPDVFEGAPLVAAVQLRAGELVVRGDLAREPWEHRLTVRPGAAGNQAIVALFGRERVADLEARGASGEAQDREIEQVGLAFQIATRLTSWIAIDEARTVTGPSRHEDMPQALPYGTTAAAFGLREAFTDHVEVFADHVEADEYGAEDIESELAAVAFDRATEQMAESTSSALIEKDDDMGEFDNKPTGESDLLEEDGTVWMSGGANNALDDDELDVSGPPATESFRAAPPPAAPTQPYAGLTPAPQRYAPQRTAAASGQVTDRPSAASGETSGAGKLTGTATPGRTRSPTQPAGHAAEPSIQVSLSDVAPTDARSAGVRSRKASSVGLIPQPRQMPTAPVSGSSARWRMVILLALLVLAIAALVWRITAR